ncbi:MAG: hypothetical protein ISS71_00030 [Phycisphaerae bacterium]|nr:hypothetical protein [Phycisphaerae bacterium]
MKTQILFILLACLGVAEAVRITLFMDTEMFIKRAQDIVIADCITEPNQPVFEAGMTYNCKLLYTLKGNREPSNFNVFTIYPLQANKQYLLTNTGGQVGDTDFLALCELSVVPISPYFDIEKLKDKSLTDQLHMIFDLRKYQLQKQLDPLLKEKGLLEKALQDRTDNLYISPGPIEFDTIHTTQATDYSSGKITYLQFGAHQMEWSRQNDNAGYLYVTEPGTQKTTWQWAVLDVNDFEQLRSKPLHVRFMGVYPPIYEQTLTVRQGQLVLLRHGENPKTVYIAKFEEQQEDTVPVRYITVSEKNN